MPAGDLHIHPNNKKPNNTHFPIKSHLNPKYLRLVLEFPSNRSRFTRSYVHHQRQTLRSFAPRSTALWFVLIMSLNDTNRVLYIHCASHIVGSRSMKPFMGNLLLAVILASTKITWLRINDRRRRCGLHTHAIHEMVPTSPICSGT